MAVGVLSMRFREWGICGYHFRSSMRLYGVRQEDHRLMMLWRLGRLSCHQECKKCGNPVSRAHFWICSGAEFEMRLREYCQRHRVSIEYDRPGMMFIDRMIDSLETRHHSEEGIKFLVGVETRR